MTFTGVFTPLSIINCFENSLIVQICLTSGKLSALTQSSGMCRSGVDKLAYEWAIENNIPIKKFYAKWGWYGKRAGPIRNTGMAKYAECLIAIWDGKSRGTYNMIKQAEIYNLKHYIMLYKK